MKPAPVVLRILAATGAFSMAAARSRAFLGVGDTSLVTVIANPAESANWAAEIARLTDQLAAARATLDEVGELRAYAGDPRAAALSVSDLSGVAAALSTLAAGPQTDADLERAWQSLGQGGQAALASALLQAAGDGPRMWVFGQAQDRDPSLYTGAAMEETALGRARSQISSEQGARTNVAGALAVAWAGFRSASTESQKQAILAEISQLGSQNEVMDARRRALIDDLDLSSRQSRVESQVRVRAEDEGALAASAQLGASELARAGAAAAQREYTLAKAPAAPPARDYSQLRLWTTADAGGAP